MVSPSGRPLQCNQQNYSWQTVKYDDNLLKVAETHPDLNEEFKQSCFGIKRATKPFSIQLINLVLEQTINADAARSLTGVIHLTNSISARHWWARNHDVGSTIINQAYPELGVPTHQDVSTDKSSYYPEKYQTIETIYRYLPSIYLSLLLRNINRFEKDMKKMSIDNFSKDYEKKKKVQVGGKIQEIKIQRIYLDAHAGYLSGLQCRHFKDFVLPDDLSTIAHVPFG
ncbi:uncharacterized protein TNIN_176351 [Trichonephila inaurata madagascariensis]|uniref:Uncharacterized protein n=1 Tax=Trichonephila inaurata madagascariensis TaxID=2747483 RepID=A0A8X6XPJ6_9ARAC|nr:uncharacterized protein TNIN_176351 [Trichonephila inaurata madagascariensis]